MSGQDDGGGQRRHGGHNVTRPDKGRGGSGNALVLGLALALMTLRHIASDRSALGGYLRQTTASATLRNRAAVVQEMPKMLPAFSDDTTVRISFVNDSGLQELANDFFKRGFCGRVKGNDTTPQDFAKHSTLVDVSFSCQSLFQNSGLGTGNFISAFYGLRMVAHALGTTDVSMQCFDAEDTKESLILPWLMGTFPRMTEAEQGREELPTVDQACANYRSIPIGYRWKDMRYEMRRMAIAMVGIPSPDHPSAAWAEENLWSESATGRRDHMEIPPPRRDGTPFYPDTELDDAVLHFRCGDLINSNHPSFGFMKFGSFSRHLSPHVRTIGIATQPFDPGAQQRNAEGMGPTKAARCKKVVDAFVRHLEEQFPRARIRIHNGRNETIALTFARMIMANETVVGITSFGVFPGVTTFGTAYIRKPDYVKAPNRWLLTSPLVQRVDNVKLVEEPMLFAFRCRKMWGADGGATVIEWFRNYSLPG